MKLDMRKIYRFEPLELTPAEPLPSGGSVYYECAECREVVNSVPHILVKCECGNLEGNGGKITMKDPQKVTPMRGILK